MTARGGGNLGASLDLVGPSSSVGFDNVVYEEPTMTLHDYGTPARAPAKSPVFPASASTSQNHHHDSTRERRAASSRAPWSESEIAALREKYPSSPWPDVLVAIPSRTRSQIKGKANHLGIARDTGDRVKIPRDISEEERKAVLRERQCRASAKWRVARRDKYLSGMREYDARPERKEAQAKRTAKKRKTASHRARIREYLARPEVKKRCLELQRKRNSTPEAKAWRKAYAEKPAVKQARRERQAAIRRTPQGMLNNRMRVAIRRGTIQGTGFGKASKILGYTIHELKIHIEKQFLKGMSWKNASEWHIDHIIPLSSFSFESIEDDGFKAAWCLTNLRPLWAIDNLKKRAKILSLL